MGYFPFDRNVREHWVYKDSQYYHVWSEMLFTARYAEEPKTFLHEGELITVEYGEFIFGRISWSEKLGISEQRLRTLISKMKKEEMIVPTKQYRKSTVYLVKNYRLYNQQSNQQESLIHQAFEGHANQQTNVTPTSNQPATNQQVTTKEESNKEIKKEVLRDMPKLDYLSEFEMFWNQYPSKKGKANAKKKWTSDVVPLLRKGELTLETIFSGTKAYIEYCRISGRTLKDGSAAVNQAVWNDNWEYDGIRYGSTISSKASRAEEQRNALKQSILGGVSIEDINQGRSRVDITPDSSSLSQLRLEF